MAFAGTSSLAPRHERAHVRHRRRWPAGGEALDGVAGAVARAHRDRGRLLPACSPCPGPRSSRRASRSRSVDHRRSPRRRPARDARRQSRDQARKSSTKGLITGSPRIDLAGAGHLLRSNSRATERRRWHRAQGPQWTDGGAPEGRHIRNGEGVAIRRQRVVMAQMNVARCNVHVGSTTTATGSGSAPRRRRRAAPCAAGPRYCFSIWITQNGSWASTPRWMTDGTHFFTAW